MAVAVPTSTTVKPTPSGLPFRLLCMSLHSVRITTEWAIRHKQTEPFSSSHRTDTISVSYDPAPEAAVAQRHSSTTGVPESTTRAARDSNGNQAATLNRRTAQNVTLALGWRATIGPGNHDESAPPVQGYSGLGSTLRSVDQSTFALKGQTFIVVAHVDGLRVILEAEPVSTGRPRPSRMPTPA